MKLQLTREWVLGKLIGGGGFGKVYEAEASDGTVAAIKLVPKAPGADRELLFIELDDVRNIVPVIESGETDDSWALVMPVAEKSLREHLKKAAGPLTVAESLTILMDIATTLIDLNGRVVHRDIKPENVLHLGGHWCLADFGIARYAEATTSPDTQKYSMSPLYAAPERWRNERATAASDVYAVGIMAYELLKGSLPFTASSLHELREQHLHADPPDQSHLPHALSALIDECLYKAAGSRPTPAALLKRLERAADHPRSDGLAKLQEVNRAEVARLGKEARQQSIVQSATDQHTELARAASKSLARISNILKESITEAAPAAAVVDDLDVDWTIRLGQATLRLLPAKETPLHIWHDTQAPKFTVVAHTSIGLTFPPNQYGYEGRTHSLWYCDARIEGQFQWFETAFMVGAFRPYHSSITPFTIAPGPNASAGIHSIIGSEYQLAWPFTPISVGELDEFIERWAGWFADAAQGRLSYPSTMPERSPQGSWRTA